MLVAYKASQRKKATQKHFSIFLYVRSPFSFHGNISLVNVITLPGVAVAPTFLGKCSGEV